MFVAAYFAEDGAWLRHVERLRELYRERRDVMFEALAEHFGPTAAWTRPEGGLFVWATLDERIDTTDLLALARTEGVAFVPGRAAYMDGRSGASSMRLNFAGIPEPEIREGISRIGRAISRQVDLLGSLTPGSVAASAAAQRSEPPVREHPEGLADVVELPRRGDGERGRRTQDR
jgi:2-aminoadipate transaminase